MDKINMIYMNVTSIVINCTVIKTEKMYTSYLSVELRKYYSHEDRNLSMIIEHNDNRHQAIIIIKESHKYNLTKGLF